MTDSVKQTYATKTWYQVEIIEYIGIIVFTEHKSRDPNQDLQDNFIGPDLGPISLQR